MTILIKVLQFFLSLSILVFIHELGHFLAAKAFKTRVEKFYLFFDWGFSLFRCKKVNGKWRFKFFAKNEPEKYTVSEYKDAAGKKQTKYEPIDLSTLPEDDWRRSDSTEYGIGWFPLGGYNKIAGMVDESMDKSAMQQPPKEWEFRSKPAWQRFIIMIAGVTMNVLLAFIIYIGLLTKEGEQYLPTKEANKYGISVDSLAYEFGLRDGDKILAVDGKYVENFSEIPMQIILDKAKTIEVERNGKDTLINLPEDAITKLLSKQDANFINYRFPFVVEDVTANSAAQAGGLQKGDVIVGILESYKNLGVYYNEKGDFTTSAVYLRRCLDLASEKGNLLYVNVVRPYLIADYARLGKLMEMKKELGLMIDNYEGIVNENNALDEELTNLREHTDGLLDQYESQNQQIETLQAQRNQYRLAFFGLLALVLATLVFAIAFKIVRKNQAKNTKH